MNKNHLAKTGAIAVVAGMFCVLGSPDGMFTFLMFYLIIHQVLKIRHLSNYKIEGTWLYLLISGAGLLVASTYNYSYGYWFGAYGDDGRFFERIKLLAGDIIPDGYTLFEIVVSLVYKVMAVITEPSVLTLLPFNWFLSALDVILIQCLADRVAGPNKISLKLTAILILLNYHFVDIFIHFYRDSFMLIFILSSLILAYENEFVKSIIPIFCSALVRGANGMLAALSLVFIIVFKKLNSALLKSTIILGVFAIVATLATEYGQVAADYATTLISVERGTSEKKQLKAILEHRKETLLDSNMQKSATNELLYQSSAYYIVKPVLTLFFPLTVESPFTKNNVLIGDTYIGEREFINIMSLVNWATILMWIYAGPLLISSLIDSFSGNINHKSISLIFVLSLIFISFVSLQTRHSCAFLILVPSIIGCLSSFNSKRIFYLRAGFVLVVLALNGYGFIKYMTAVS